MRVPIEVKKRCVELLKSGKTSREIFTQYYSKLYSDTGFKSFSSMLSKWKTKVFADDEILEIGNLGYKFTPHATTVQVGKDGSITQSWIKSKTSDSLYLELIECIKDLPPFAPVRRIEQEIVDQMLEITFDDMHFGIATLADYESTLQDTLSLICEVRYREINIVLGEDLLHTDNFKGTTSNGTFIGEVDIPKAYKEVLVFYFNIVSAALEHADRVRVIYSMGNHSESLSWTIVQVLKTKFPQIEIDDSLEPRKVILFYKVFIGVTHGDTIKGNLRDVKELFVEENLEAYALASVKEIHIGHYHVEKESGDINGCIVRRLSTKVPVDKWHKFKGFTAATKRFMLFRYGKDRLISIYYV